MEGGASGGSLGRAIATRGGYNEMSRAAREAAAAVVRGKEKERSEGGRLGDLDGVVEGEGAERERVGSKKAGIGMYVCMWARDGDGKLSEVGERKCVWSGRSRRLVPQVRIGRAKVEMREDKRYKKKKKTLEKEKGKEKKGGAEHINSASCKRRLQKQNNAAR